MQKFISAAVLFAALVSVTPAFAITSEQGTSPSGSYNNLTDPGDQAFPGGQGSGVHFNMSGGNGGNSNSATYGRPDDSGNMPATVGSDMQHQQQLRSYGVFDQLQH